MKKLGLLLFATSLFLGCSKDDKNETSKTESCLVTKLTILPSKFNNDELIIVLNYDQSGRIIETISKSDDVNNEIDINKTTKFTYSANKITAITKEQDEQDDIYEFTLDDKGRVITGKGESFTFNFSYNVAGQLNKATEVLINHTATEQEYGYTNNNLTSLKVASGTFSLNYDLTKNHTPYSTILSPYAIFEEFENGELFIHLYENGFLGKKSTNRVTAIKNVAGSNTPFTYKDDEKGNATSITTIVENSPVIHLLEYYCK